MAELRDGQWVESESEIEEIQLKAKYRALLCSSMGIDVLSDILQICHFGCTLDPENKVQISEYNVGITILAKCDVFKPDNFREIVMNLCLPIPIKK